MRFDIDSIYLTAVWENYTMTLASVLGRLQQLLAKLAKSLICTALLLMVVSCSGSSQSVDSSSTVRESSNTSLGTSRPMLKQVSAPALIQQLAPWLDSYAPQVQIQAPKANQVLDDTTVSVVLRVQDLPIYKDEALQLGPHVELLVDNQPYGPVYDLEQPIVLENLTPGTHTLRAFATRPWHESFKNEGAYGQVTFHVFAETDENFPTADQPLLTYGASVGTYGAEPVLLDFYLTEAPLHQVAQDNPMISDWRVRYTINGDSLTLDDWESIYIEGLHPGQNWVQLTLVDEEGTPIAGVFNNTVRLIDYDPNLNDSLAKIVRGDLTLAEVGGIVDPSYEPPVPEVIVPPEPAPVEDTVAGDELNEPENDRVVPDVPELGVPEPKVSEPKESALEIPESKMSEPEVSEPELSKPDVSVPEVPKQDTSEPQVQAPVVITPEVIEPEVIEPDVIKFKPFKSLDIREDETVEDDAPKAADDLVKPGKPTDEPLTEPAQDVEPIQSAGESNVSDDESPDTEPAAALESEPSAAEAAQPAEIDDADKAASEAPIAEESPTTKRRYLQRLYDYRERSMQTYGRDR